MLWAGGQDGLRCNLLLRRLGTEKVPPIRISDPSKCPDVPEALDTEFVKKLNLLKREVINVSTIGQLRSGCNYISEP